MKEDSLLTYEYIGLAGMTMGSQGVSYPWCAFLVLVNKFKEHHAEHVQQY